jgi:hypothetical protein
MSVWPYDIDLRLGAAFIFFLKTMLPFLPGSVALAVVTATAVMATAAIPKTCRRSTIVKHATKCSVDGQWTLGQRVVGWCTDGNIDQFAETPLGVVDD